jgi:hypothetical protein
MFERAKRVCDELGDRVAFVTYDTSEREVFEEWGIADGIFIDGKRLNYGPPLSYEKIRNRIEKKVKKLPATPSV